QNEILLGEEASSRSQPAAHHALRGYVASPQIFLQQIRGKCVDDSWIEFHLFVTIRLAAKRTKRSPELFNLSDQFGVTPSRFLDNITRRALHERSVVEP